MLIEHRDKRLKYPRAIKLRIPLKVATDSGVKSATQTT